MQEVVKDKGGTWYFNGGNTYVCLDNNGKMVGRIFPQHLPNPSELWKTKCQRLKIDMQSKEAQSLKPSEAVFKLWEHKNG